MTIKIRAGAPADVGALVAMAEAHNALYDIATGALQPRNFRSAIFGKNAFVFCDIAETLGTEAGADKAGNGEAGVVGYALSHDCFSTDDGERGVYLLDLFVEQAWRREGAGKLLMAAVAKRARKRGAKHVWWTTHSRNFQARRFYRKLEASDNPVHAHAIDGEAFAALAKGR